MQKNKEQILLIGYEKITERMYPHLYDFISELKKHFEVVYYDGDDRGAALYQLGLVDGFTLSDFFNVKKTAKALFYVLCYVKSCFKKMNLRKLLMEDYSAVIAIDHQALNVVVNKVPKNKIIFWSQDIIAAGHVWLKSKFISKMLEQNRRNVENVSLIVVQDENRGKLLDSTIGCHNIPKFYLPVSLENTPYLREIAAARLNKRTFETINIMQITISRERGSYEILKQYQSMPEDVLLHFQGGKCKEMISVINGYKRKPYIYPVCNSIREMQRHISIADIGLIFYNLDVNEYYTRHASGQLVEFLRQGIPIIAIKSQDVGEYVANKMCGISINDMNELYGAINQIKHNYENYSRNARKLYSDQYDIKVFVDKFVRKIAH